MLVGYFDESGLDDRSPSFWLAGYVAHISNWFEFSRAWNHAIENHGVDTLHTTDLVNGWKTFSGWPPERRTALLDDVISIINSSDIHGFGAGVVKADYERAIVNTGFSKEAGWTPEWWRQPYLLAFQQCVVGVVLKADVLAKSERINFVFDQQGTYGSRCQSVFASMSDGAVWPRGDRLGSVEFRPKRGCTPLQAADLLAYELRKRLDHRLTEPERAVRRSMARLSRSVASSRFLDERAIRRFMDEVRTSRVPRKQAQ